MTLTTTNSTTPITDDRPAPRAARGSVRRRALVVPILAGAAALVYCVVVFTVDPNQPGHYPLCPFHALTGWDCPGCGATRGMHALLHGDVVGALDHNVLLLLAVPVAVISWAAWVRRAWTGSARRLVVPPRVVYALVVLVLVFWVARNLPGVPFLAST